MDARGNKLTEKRMHTLSNTHSSQQTPALIPSHGEDKTYGPNQSNMLISQISEMFIRGEWLLDTGRTGMTRDSKKIDNIYQNAVK